MASIGYATLNIVPTAEGFGSALSAQTVPAVTSAGAEAGKGFGGSLVESVKSFVAPLAALFAVDKIKDFFSGAIEEASGLNEATNALEVTFGSAAGGIENLGKSAATNLGLSELQFDNLSVKFSNFAKTIAGPGGDVVSTMGDLTQRAADFASVYNIDVDQATDLFQSSLAGLSRPMREYGIDTSAATVAAYAYANGIAAQGSELTETQRIQATYGSLMEQTAKVQGDFANTSDQLANRQRITAARFADIRGEIGGLLLPVMNSLSGVVLNNVLPAFQWVADTAPKAFGWIKDNLTPIGILTAGLVAFTVAQNASAIATGIVSGATKLWAAAQAAMNVVLDANPIGIIILAVAALAAGIYELATKTTFFQTLWADVSGWFVKTWGDVKTAFSDAWNSIVDFLKSAADRIVSLFYNWTLPGLLLSHWTDIKTTATNVWNGLVDFVTGIPGRFVTGLSAIGSLVGGVLSRAWSSFSDGAHTAWDAIVDYIRSLPGRFVSGLGNISEMLVSAGSDLIGGFVRGIKNAAGTIVDTIKRYVTDLLPSFVKNALGIHSPSRVFMALGENVALGMALGIANGAGAVADAADALTPDASWNPEAVASFRPPTKSQTQPSGLAAALTPALVAAIKDAVEPPDTLVIRDADGTLIGRMRVEAGLVSEGYVTPLDEGRASWRTPPA